MMSPVRPLAAIAALALVAGCATPRFAADVTRFHAQPPAAQGTTVALRSAGEGTLQDRARLDAVAGAMREAGFTVVPVGGQAPFVADVRVAEEPRPGPVRPPRFSVGLGGGTFGRNVGVGGSAQVPVGRAQPTTLVETALELRLSRAADGQPVWEGRAETVDQAGTSGVETVGRLARAALAGFPGPSGTTQRWVAPAR